MGKVIKLWSTCMALDIIISTPEIINKIKKYLIKYISFLQNDIENNNDYGRIINKRHFKRILELLEKTNGEEIFTGSENIKQTY